MDIDSSVRRQGTSRLLLLICYLGFVSLGLPDTLIGVAWPSVRDHFHLRQSDLSWIFFGGGCSYFVSSFFAGRLLKIMNVGALLALSSALVAFAAFDYSWARAWLFFAAGSLFHGLGSGAIDSGLNHFVASHFSARHMNWLHACYSLGAMLGPLLMTAMITGLNSWRMGYLTVAVILLSLSVLFLATRALWTDSPASSNSSSEADSNDISAFHVLRRPLVWLHIVLFFVYTGLEVALGQWSFTVLTEARLLNAERAGLWVTVYWAGILAGRIIFGFVVDRLRIDSLIRYSMGAAVLGTALFSLNRSAWVSLLALALSGLGLAVIFPCLMTRTPQRFGQSVAAHAIGFQVGAAMLGAAALPSVIGFIAQNVGLNSVPAGLYILAIALFSLHELVLFTSDRNAVRD